MKPNRTNIKDAATYPSRIIQFGEGNFLRAFADWIIQKMNNEINFNTGIDIVQPRPGGRVDLINRQDGLYHVYLKGIKNGKPLTEYEFIQCINQGVNPYTEFEMYKKAILNPELRFVISNTTEAGICLDKNDTLDMQPQLSFPGKVAALLYERFNAFNGASDKGLIFFPCELIDRNGDLLKKYVLTHAEDWNLGDKFKQWLETTCVFCNTLVDRIVPGFPKDDINEIQEELGYEDNLVVAGEYFHLWIIEAPEWVHAEFPADKAGLEVKFVNDMKHFREQKVRILNGSHTGSYATSFLYGIETVREACDDPVIGKFIKDLVFDEIVPTLDGTRKELELFANKILERFANPFIQHQWYSIALNAMSKWETRNLPSLLNFVKVFNKLPRKLVFSMAAMIAYYKAESEGRSYIIQDEAWILDFYRKEWEKCDGTPASMYQLTHKVLSLEKIWKQDLNEVPDFTITVSHYLFLIQQAGMKIAVKSVLSVNNPFPMRN